MHRRALLQAVAGTAASIALAGCFMEPPGTTLRLVPATDDRIVEDLVTPVEEFPPERRTIVTRLLETGSITRTEDYDPTIYDGTYVLDGGTFSRISTTRVETITREGYAFDVYRLPEDTTVADETGTVAFEDLPETDRRVFEAAGPGGMEPDLGAVVFRNASEFDPENSTFAADGPVVVRYEGARFRVDYRGPQTREDERYRYRLHEVADTRSGFVAAVEAEFLFTIDPASLSADERDVLESAIVESSGDTAGGDGDGDGGGDDDRSGYSEGDDLSPAFQSLLEYFASHDRPRPALSVDQWLCRYEGERYWAIVEHAYDVITSPAPYRTPTE